MAKAHLTYPFAAIHGSLKPSDKFYLRVLNGQCIMQQKPRRSSPRQRAMRLSFGQKYKGAHSPIELEVAP